MANGIIPPEYYGLYGLGSALGQFGETLKENKERKKRDALQRIQLYSALGLPKRWLLAEAGEAGLIDKNAWKEYNPVGEDALDEARRKLQLFGTAGLTQQEEEMIAVKDYGAPPGLTIAQARERGPLTLRGEKAQVAVAEEGVAEIARAKQQREDEAAVFSDPQILKAMGFDPNKPLTPGAISAMQKLSALQTALQSPEMNRVEMAERKARIAHLISETALNRAQMAKLAATGGLSESMTKYVDELAKVTGHRPDMIISVFNTPQEKWTESQKLVAEDLGRELAARRAEVGKRGRDAGSKSFAVLKTIVDLLNAGAISADFARQEADRLLPQVYREMGEAVLDVPGEVRTRLGMDWLARDVQPRTLVGKEAIDYVQSRLKEAEEVVGGGRTEGEEAETADITADEARRLVADAARVFGTDEKGVKEAIAKMEGSTLNEAEKKLMREAYRAAYPNLPDTIFVVKPTTPAAPTTAPRLPPIQAAPPTSVAPASTPTSAPPVPEVNVPIDTAALVSQLSQAVGPQTLTAEQARQLAAEVAIRGPTIQAAAPEIPTLDTLRFGAPPSRIPTLDTLRLQAPITQTLDTIRLAAPSPVQPPEAAVPTLDTVRLAVSRGTYVPPQSPQELAARIGAVKERQVRSVASSLYRRLSALEEERDKIAGRVSGRAERGLSVPPEYNKRISDLNKRIGEIRERMMLALREEEESISRAAQARAARGRR